MTHKPRPSAWFTGIVGLALLAGCQPNTPAGNMVTAAQPAPGPAPSQAPVPQGGIGGVASLLGENFAGADIKVYKPGQAAPVGTGTTRADGTFTVALGVAGANVATGAPLKVVASRGGQTLVAIGAAGIISGGAGNIISGGAGNIISGGAGNVISGGAGNYGVLAVDMQTRLSVESTLAVLKLGDALEAAMAQMGSGGAAGDAAVEKMFAALAKLTEAASETLRNASPEALDALTRAFDPNSATAGTLSAEVAAMAATLNQAAAAAATLINQAVATATAPEAPTGTQPDNNTAQPGTPNQPSGATSGGGSSGSDGADEDEDEDETSGTVSLTPNLDVPLKVYPSPIPPSPYPSTTPSPPYMPGPFPMPSMPPPVVMVFQEDIALHWEDVTANNPGNNILVGVSEEIVEANDALRITFNTGGQGYFVLENTGNLANLAGMTTLKMDVQSSNVSTTGIYQLRLMSDGQPVGNFQWLIPTLNTYSTLNFQLTNFTLTPAQLAGRLAIQVVHAGPGNNDDLVLDNIRFSPY